MLDRQLLTCFMDCFYGYGNPGAKYWFIGLEEGGGTSMEEIARRLAAWDALGRPSLADLIAFHERAGITDYSAERPPLQSTWKQLIRLFLAAERQQGDVEAVRTYQRDHLGRANGETALIELMPLPSPSTAQWLYGSAGLGIVADRASYTETVLDHRVKGIRGFLDEHRPKVVVFYGFKRRDVWSRIADGAFTASVAGSFALQSPSTLYLMIRHPVARGAKNAEFEAVGGMAKGLLNLCG